MTQAIPQMPQMPPMQQVTQVLIADDHPLVRDALTRTLRALAPHADVIEADSFASAHAAMSRHAPALALIDLHMPGMDGLDGVRRLREAFPAVRLAVVSGDDDPAVMRAAFAAGAVAFLPKGDAPGVLQEALRDLLDGRSYLPPQMLGAAKPDTSGLTPRQKDVLRSLMRGQPNKLIARELGVTEGTVKIHIAAILRALQARNRTEAVVMARQLGVTP